jgi:hypothetical protein
MTDRDKPDPARALLADGPAVSAPTPASIRAADCPVDAQGKPICPDVITSGVDGEDEEQSDERE